jgi:hypothetical protein
MVDTYPDLFWGYTVIWSVIVVYTAILGFRIYNIERIVSRYKKEQEM